MHLSDWTPTPGKTAHWNAEMRGQRNRQFYPWPNTVLVLALQKRTAHIEARRADGSVRRRWVKRSRLYPAYH